MKTIKKVEITPVFLDGYMIPFEDMKDNHIYISEKYMTSTHRCLCGCGTQTVLPLNSGKETFGWNLIKEPNGTVSFTPSILNPPVVVSDTVDSTDEFVPPSWTKEYASHHYIITKNVANFV
ncbi:MAG TPA: DUF6527 family protein [Cyclobacteriaceae bacterium]|nr:DUF6527 family protein [Cyclobacteriaceae bacterium]